MSNLLPAPHYPIQLRTRKTQLLTAIACATGFAVIGVSSVYAAGTNLDSSFRYPVETAVFCAAFWGSWFSISLFSVAACLREELTVTSTSISLKGVFRTKILAISDVSYLKWRLRPASCGSAVIESRATRVTIDFNSYTADERAVLAAFLRKSISEDVHENWISFDECWRRQSLPPQRSRGTAFACMTLFVATGVICAYLWRIQLGISCLIASLASFACALCYLYRILMFVPAPKTSTDLQ